MVIRKPYAFLIKHFRLVHLIITIFLGLTIYKTRSIYLFLNSCIEEAANTSNALNYVNYNIFVYIGIAIFLMFIIRWLLKYKDKPRKIYLFSMLYYAVISAVILLIMSYLNTLPGSIIIPKTIRLYRDTTLIILLVQYALTIVMLIRGLGFDIKKFNFKKDFQDLNINELDDEEVEVELFNNKDSIMQSVRKQKREFGYYLKEFKGIVIVILLIIIIIITIKGINYFKDKLKIYKENDSVGINNVLTITDSYYKVTEEGNYIIIRANLRTNVRENVLNAGIVNLHIGKEVYHPNKNICTRFGDKGVCYKKQYLTTEDLPYIFVYEIDDLKLEKDHYIEYNESYTIRYKIKLNLKEY